MAAPPTKPTDRLRLFLSHCRKDMEAADHMAEAPEQAGFEVTIDRATCPMARSGRPNRPISSAPPTPWPGRSVSPASVVSEWRNWEPGEVQRLNKRLFPVAIAPVPPASRAESVGLYLLARGFKGRGRAGVPAWALQDDTPPFRRHTGPAVSRPG